LGGGAAGLYRGLRDRDIFVRYFDQDRLKDSLRITVGTPEQNNQLLAGIDAVLGGSAAS
jgi:histidinol-phosphate aminotransferase